MTTRSKYASMALAAGCAIILAECGCGKPAHRIDPEGRETITTVSGLNIQDAKDAAERLSNSLLDSGVLGRGGHPSRIAIDRYVNATSQQIDRDEVLKRIRVTLNRAGVAQIVTTINSQGNIGGESNIGSKVAKQEAEEARVDKFLDEDHGHKAGPEVDYALTFKILEDRVRASRVRQVTYTFQMSLTDLAKGTAVWEDQTQITKQGTKPSVGW